MTIPTYSGDVPYLTTEQMVEVDRLMIQEFKIELVQMMENAGRNLAHLALPKAGLRAPGVAVHVGELFLADISVPPEVYAPPSLSLTVGPLFAQSDIVRLR